MKTRYVIAAWFRRLGACLFAMMFMSGTWAMAETEGRLPRVMIIGDSISLGYTPFVVQLLKGRAQVVHNPGNAGPTQRGLDELDAWLGEEKWDVIHFNWGLWDMYHWRYWKYDQSPAAYEKNLEVLVKRLEQTGARLIWAATTPACPAPETKQQVMVEPAVEQLYLQAAERVMQRHGVEINDLHAFMAPRRKTFALADNDVHYNEAGYRELARLVASKITEVIESRNGGAE